MVLEFHNDGFYKDSSLKYYKNFSYRTKKQFGVEEENTKFQEILLN